MLVHTHTHSPTEPHSRYGSASPQEPLRTCDNSSLAFLVYILSKIPRLGHQAYSDSLSRSRHKRQKAGVPWSHLTPHLERAPLQQLQRCIRTPRKVVSETVCSDVCIHFCPVHANAAMHNLISSRLEIVVAPPIS